MRATPTAPLRFLTKRWRRLNRIGLSRIRSGTASGARRNAAEARSRQPAPAEEAFQTAIAVAKQQGTRSFELRAALRSPSSTNRPAAPPTPTPSSRRRSKALRRRRKCPRSPRRRRCSRRSRETEEVKAEAAQRQRLTQLHVAYGNALMAARGYGAPETTEAFARARESASGDKDAPERLAADYGLWVGSFVRGELPSMRAHAAAFLSDVEARPDSPEAGVAHRAAGISCWFAGEYREARDIWNARSPCSNPAATTIWPFASDRTPASRRCLSGDCVVAARRRRSRDFPRRRAADADRGPHPYRHAAHSEECTRPCSN